AGVHLAAAYPGTPSTEILEELSRFPHVYCEWSTNEKVAVDVAVGAAYAGRRALAAMKHVGLNVAADSFFYASFTGAEAGLVIVSADDPGMHSSQNEQDNRRFAQFARVPCLEPSDSQECKDFAVAAFDVSETFDTPVLLRTTTRTNHSSTPVELGERTDVAPRRKKFPRDPAKYVMIPANARARHPLVEQRVLDLAAWAETTPLNRIEWRDRSVGIVTAGIAYQYAREVLPAASVLKLGMVYPVPEQLIRAFAAGVERLIVLEELDPVLEQEIRLLGIACEGKSIFPLCGELDPTVVRSAAAAAGLAVDRSPVTAAALDLPELPARPPVLCAGCPHRGVFQLLSKKKAAVSGDIGCYTLGLLPPLSAIHSCGCMGAGIGVAHGAGKAGIGERMVAVIGDSTFYHTGMPALA
ncbi:MAG: indolepyruvate ferredoxin oxidoreductase subunit alpha, partial [Acidobacteria bacterium 21-70-11]